MVILSPTPNPSSTQLPWLRTICWLLKVSVGAPVIDTFLTAMLTLLRGPSWVTSLLGGLSCSRVGSSVRTAPSML